MAGRYGAESKGVGPRVLGWGMESWGCSTWSEWGTELPPEVTATPHLHSRQLAAELSRKGETGGAQVLV